MKKITRETLAAEAAERWRAQYPKARYVGTPKEGIHAALAALGSQPNPDDVDAAVGNDSWTEVPTCGECGKSDSDFVFEVGAPPGYESHTAYLCGACITELAQLSDSATGENDG